ncbi:MAG: UDP-glucose 4-epimerase [Planctomycetota bacterium]
MKILVTGGCGYIGSHAALRLLEDGHSVTVIDNLFRGHRAAADLLANEGGARFRFVEADIRDTDALVRTMREQGTEIVIHFAALTYVGESVEKPAEYFSNNLEGGLSILRAMRSAGVDRMVFSSTAATYGEPPQDAMPITESTPQRPVNPYGDAKLQFEMALRDECASSDRSRPLAAIALRYFNVAGADPNGRLGEDHRPETHLVPICLEVALGKRPHLTIFGEDYPTPDGTCIRDYVHVVDLVDAHVAALAALEPAKFKCWNIGIGRGYSVREVLESCRRVTGHAIPARLGERRAGDPPALYADPGSIRRDLGWKARFTDLDEIVATAWRWYQAHPNGYR